MMAYKLHRLAAGSFDLTLDDAIIGSVVRDVSPGGQVEGWRAELLDDVSSARRPHPFTQTAHHFPGLGDALAWLGDASAAKDD